MAVSKNKAKERFLNNIQGVDREQVMQAIRNNTTGLDLYTYFVTYNACNTGDVDIKDIKDYVHKLYADWYFLNRSNTANSRIYSLTHQSLYSPQNITTKDCFELILSNKYSDILPVKIQYLNKLEEKFFVQIDLDKLYARKTNDQDYSARLYLNMPADSILDFTKEFVDRAYLSEWSGIIKFLSQDDRSDSIIIYTDFNYAEKIVEEIEDIFNDYKHKYSEIGPVNILLGKVNDRIGFGENPKGNKTYFYSRCEALSSITNLALNNVLKDSFVATEKSVIFRNDGESYTPTEYLAFLIEKNIINAINKTIKKLEKENKDSKALDRLYKLKEDLSSEVDINSEVNSLKKSLTRHNNYTFKLNGVETEEYNYVDKLYNLFTSDNKEQKKLNVVQKKRLVSAQIFKPTEEIYGESTKDILTSYFKLALIDALTDVIESAKDDLNNTKYNPVLSNLKQKKLDKLNRVLRAILDDDDSGKEYLDDCVYDYIRILSTGAMEDVEILIDSSAVNINADVNSDILSGFPELTESIDKLTITPEFINNTLLHFDINMNDLCVNKDTKYLSKSRDTVNDGLPRFYYDPDREM